MRNACIHGVGIRCGVSKSSAPMSLAVLVATVLALASTAVGSQKPVSARAREPHAQFQIVPEYERRLGRVLLLVPAAEEGEAKRALLLQAAYREILTVLPPHTVVEVAVSGKDEAFVRETLRAVGARETTRLHVVSPVELDMWAQDVGESVVLDGKPHFLVSATSSTSNAKNHILTSSRSTLAKEVFGVDSAVETSFVFEAGNWAFDRTPDGLRVFVGYNDVEATIQQEAERGRRVSQRAVLESISSVLAGAEVVMLGTERQSPYIFHLDQAFVLLADRTAVVAQIERKGSPEARQLAEIRRQLEEHGYRTLAIPHTLEEVRQYRSSTNVVPFVDADGRRRLLFPVFASELAKEPRRRPLTKDDLTGKARVAFETYEAAGYAPTPVPDFVSGAGGSIHCVINVLD